MPDKEFLTVALDTVMDTYGASRIKEMTQNHTGTTTRKILIGAAGQAMPKSRERAILLSDENNKTEVIQIIADYFKADNF